MSGPSIQRGQDIQPGGCPGAGEYGRGLSRTVVHVGECCARWAWEHQGVEWTRGYVGREAPPAQVERDLLELGLDVAEHLYYQQGAWWDLLEGER